MVARRRGTDGYFAVSATADGLPDDRVLPPPVILEEVRIEGRPVERSRLAQGVTLPPGSRDLEIHYTAPSFVSPDKVRFRYRLEGFEEEWVEAGTRRTAFFTNLPRGDYGFQGLAANSDGVWSSAGATVPERGSNPDRLFAAADQALYRAKAEGRNRVR